MIKGYSPRHFYWEFIIIYRKLLIISIATFLSRIAKLTQALLALAVLVFSLTLQNQYKPYSHPSLNTMEHRSILVSVATIFFGLYYLDNSLGEGWQDFFFAVILAVNVYFLQFWLRKLLGAFFVIAVNRFGWLNQHFVVINETLAIPHQAFTKTLKKKGEESSRTLRSRLPALSKAVYMLKISQQDAYW
jgi:hypothetical protein